MNDARQKWYSKHGLWSLFLCCAFPLHAWALILIFGDISWVSERTNLGDAIGVASYGAVFTFTESLIFFLIMTLLGFLVSRKWDEAHRIALLGALALILSLWGIIGQIFFLAGFQIPEAVSGILIQSGHPIRVIYGVLVPLLLLTFLVPTVLALWSDKFIKILNAIIERISVVTWFYLLLDFTGLIIVIARNLA